MCGRYTVLHLVVVEDGLMWQGQLRQIRRDAWFTQMSWRVQCRPSWVNLGKERDLKVHVSEDFQARHTMCRGRSKMAPWEEATRRCLAVIPFSVMVSLMDATSLTGKMYACRSTNGTTGFSMEENMVELP